MIHLQSILRRWRQHAALAVALLLLWAAGGLAHAKEGLWLPEQQPNWPTQPHASAVLKVGGCTGTFVSSDGLVLTNHHCIIDLLQYRSTLENNYLVSGYLAINSELELIAPQDFQIAHTLARTDVTAQVTQGLSARVTGSERFNIIANNRNELLRRCEDNDFIQCRVVEHYDGAGYLLVRDQLFPRVKLVWAPPVQVGHFGGVEDNWQWPRHSADLALLRVYNKDGSPYQPAHWLPLSPAAPADGEAVYVAGYPGLTQRHRLHQEAALAMQQFYPQSLRYLERWLAVLVGAMENSPDISLRYVPSLVKQGNRYQNFIGLLTASEVYDVLPRIAEQEQALRTWIASSEDKERYQAALATTERALDARAATMPRQVWWNFFQELQLPVIAQRLHRLAQESGRPDDRRTRGFQSQQVPAIRAQLIGQARQFAPEVEQRLLVELLQLYLELPADQRIGFIDSFFQLAERTSREALEERVAEIYAATQLHDIDAIERLLMSNINEVRRSNDPWLQFAVLSAEERLRWDLQERELRGLEQQGRSVLMEAFRRFANSEQRRIADNANRTYRLSAGVVAGTEAGLPARTTLQSLLSIAGSEPRYELPFNMHAAVAVHGAGCLAHEPEDLTLNFLSSADGTGGSSGSPTVNSRGELIGLVFDSTSDAIVSDWYFAEARHRLIHADVRYLLWLLRYVYQAHELMAELGFAQTEQGCTLNGLPIIPEPAPTDDLPQDPATLPPSQ